MRESVDVQFTYEDPRSVAELSNESGAFMLRIITNISCEHFEPCTGNKAPCVHRPSNKRLSGPPE